MSRPSLVCAAILVPLFLTGCSFTPGTVLGPQAAEKGPSIAGKTFGGQQPVVGAHVYLFAASTAGYGSPSISLLNAAATGLSDSIGAYVVTGNYGQFNISGDYTCTLNQQLYLYVLGGNPGAGVNSAAGFLAALGACPVSGNLASTVPFVYVDEVSTVAAAYALAGYATDATHIAASSTSLAATGLANAFANASNLAPVATGIANTTTPAGNGTVPQAELNTLADILASCVNTTGPGSLQCSTLFSSALSAGTSGATPTDTATAAINIAHNPTSNVATLYSLQPATGAPYQPTLSAAPGDFTVQIAFTGGGLNTGMNEANVQSNVNNVAVDASGNVWHANFDGNSLSKLSPLGAPLSGASGFTDGSLNSPVNVAVDVAGNVWTANNAANTISAFTAAGTTMSGSPFSAGGINAPLNLSIDASGYIWTINGNSTVSHITNAGVGLAGSPYSSNALASPIGMVVQPAGNVWVTNSSTPYSIAAYTGAGAAAPNSPFTGNGLDAPYGIAIDAGGNGWVANDNSLSKFTSAGAVATGSPFLFTNGAVPTALSIDGLGNVWVTDYGNRSILKVSNGGTTLSGAIGFQPSNSLTPESIAVDGSGNVWYSVLQAGTLFELVGAAAPVVTPLSYGVANNLLGTRP